jgi:hypothetical protein
MPRVITHVKHTPQVEFEKQLARDPQLLYGGVGMGDSKFDHTFMDKIKPTVKGIHHFSKSNTNRNVFSGKYGCAPPDV